jgi:hypothetical protein
MSFNCTYCENTYGSLQSCKNHIRIKHPENKKAALEIKKKIICEFCGKRFTRNANLKFHVENTCDTKINSQHKNSQTTEQTIELQNQINELKKEIVELKNAKPKTEVINKTINNYTNNITNNGTIINTIYINRIGTENLLDLTDKECDEIFGKEISSVVSLVKLVNFNERLPSNHSFCSKSLEGKYLLAYDVDKSCTESLRKKYFCHELLENSVNRLEILYQIHKNKMSKIKQKKIENNIKFLKDIKNRDYSDKILKEIKNQLIQLSYNHKDTVLKTWKNHKTQGKTIKKSVININDSDSGSELSEDLDTGFDI